MRRFLALCLCLCLILSLGCVGFAEGSFTPGTYEAEARGFGGTVRVTLTVDSDSVTEITVVGADETPSVGGQAIEHFNARLIGISSADEVDAVSGATFTSAAVKAAVADCLAQAEGLAADTGAPLIDGSYQGEGFGFNLTVRVPVTVEVKDGRLAAIEVGENGETNGFIDTVINKFIPRVLDSQSLAVDAITGATASSNGVRQGIENALKGAGMDLAGMYTPIEKSTASESYETDVLVIGMGSSGTTAALSAAETGVSVLAIDKAGKWGGTGATTSGPANINAPSQVAAEIVDWKDPIQGEHTKAPGEPLVDADALYQTWLDYTTIDGVQGAKPELIAKAIYESGETCDWLQDYGFAFGPAVGLSAESGRSSPPMSATSS